MSTNSASKNSCKEKGKFSPIMNNLYLFLTIAIAIINVVLLIVYTDIVKNIQESGVVHWASNQLSIYLPKILGRSYPKIPNFFRFLSWADQYVISVKKWSLQRIIRMPIVAEFITNSAKNAAGNAISKVTKKIDRVGDNFIWMFKHMTKESVINLYTYLVNFKPIISIIVKCREKLLRIKP